MSKTYGRVGGDCWKEAYQKAEEIRVLSRHEEKNHVTLFRAGQYLIVITWQTGMNWWEAVSKKFNSTSSLVGFVGTVVTVTGFIIQLDIGFKNLTSIIVSNWALILCSMLVGIFIVRPLFSFAYRKIRSNREKSKKISEDLIKKSIDPEIKTLKDQIKRLNDQVESNNQQKNLEENSILKNASILENISKESREDLKTKTLSTANKIKEITNRFKNVDLYAEDQSAKGKEQRRKRYTSNAISAYRREHFDNAIDCRNKILGMYGRSENPPSVYINPETVQDLYKVVNELFDLSKKI